MTPKANYNRVGFTPVSTQRIRVQVTHAPGFRTALTEVMVYNRGGGPGPDPDPPSNLAATATPASSGPS